MKCEQLDGCKAEAQWRCQMIIPDPRDNRPFIGEFDVCGPHRDDFVARLASSDQAWDDIARGFLANAGYVPRRDQITIEWVEIS